MVQQSLKYVDVARFDECMLPEYGFSAIVGKRKCGKTNLAFHLARSRKDAFTGIPMIIAGSEKVRQDWSKVVHSSFIHEPSTELLQRIIDNQNKLVAQYGRDNFPDQFKIKLTIDDCGSLGWFMRSTQMKYLSSNGRHCFIDVVVLVQYIYQLITEIRENIDMLFVFKTGNVKNIKTLHAEFLTCTELRVVTALVLRITQNWGCLVISNCNDGDSPSKICFSLKIKEADPENNTLIGDPQLVYWAIKHSKEAFEASVLAENEQHQDNDNNNEEEENIVDVNELMHELQLDDPYKSAYSDRFGRIIVRQVKDKFD